MILTGKMFRTFAAMLPLLLAALPLRAEFAVRETPDGRTALLCDGRELFSDLAVAIGDGKGVPEGSKRSAATLPDGSIVYELWNEDPATRFRREIALRKDGVAEITFVTDVPALTEDPARRVRFLMPYAAVSGGAYEGLSGWRNAVPVKGTFAEDLKNGEIAGSPLCFLAVPVYGQPLIFDFKPLGPGNPFGGYRTGSVRGVMNLRRLGDKLEMSADLTQPRCGGFIALKVTIRKGVFGDYDRLHALRTFAYRDHLKPRRLYSFGAEKVGKLYTPMQTLPFDPARGAGWVKISGARATVGAPEGAYYGCVTGRDGVFRITGLPDGWYIFTVGGGNYTGLENRFSVSVNGTEFAREVTVPNRTVTLISRAVRLAGGEAEVKLDGDFLISTLGVQFLMAKDEDFTMDRGFWVADGYEPGAIYRNEDTRGPYRIASSVSSFPLPEFGKEAVGRPKKLHYERALPDPNAPKLQWLHQARMFRLLSNSATLAEFDAPGALEQWLDQELKGKNYNAAMLSGMHTRLNYVGHVKRGTDAVKRIADAAHARGLKLFDHHSTTLAWNLGAGFRVLMEHLPELGHAVNDQLPSFQYCLNNPAFTRRYLDHAMELVRAGVDGFQIDEVKLWEHACGCAYCRKLFHEETGWYLPVNELDKRLGDLKSELWQEWFVWRRKKVGDWFVNFRREAEKIDPYITLSSYTTHGGVASSAARRNASSDLFETTRAINFYGTEVMSRNPLMTSRSLIPFRKMKNVLMLGYGVPIWTWIYASTWQSNYFGYAVSNMHGQTALLSDVPIPEGVRDWMIFDASELNMPRGRTRMVAPAALYFSRSSRDWNPSGSFRGELFGTAQTLEMMHQPYEMISEASLTEENLRRYRVLVLAGTGCLSDEELAKIKNFASEGGTVLLSAMAGRCTPFGAPRAEWGFADVFGVTPRRAKKIELKAVGKQKDGSDAVALAKPIPLDYAFHPNVPARLYGVRTTGKPTPLAVEKPYGKGRMICLASQLGIHFYEREMPIGAAWAIAPDPALETVFRELLADVMKEAHCLDTNAPDRVYLTLWRGDDALWLHVLNGTAKLAQGEPLRHTVPDVPFPPLAENLTFTVDGTFRKAFAASPDYEGKVPLALTTEDGRTTVILPKERLKAYTLIKLEP